MKELPIGKILIENRHRLGITQDDLAEYIGVSKASVSKWETAATYPDITLLPRLATFFNISIDELMGYEPQMTKTDIRKLYRELTCEFASRPFNEAMEHCRNIAGTYFSCLPLLFQIGVLYVNHCMLGEDPQKAVEILEEARTLFERVKKESDDITLAKQALNMEAFCLLNLGKANEVCELLELPDQPRIPPEPLLAKACQMLGKTEEAKKILQTGMYQSICELLNFLPAYMELCLDDQAAFEATWLRAAGIADAFRLESLHPSLLLTLYLSAAQGFMAFGQKDKALDLLEQYAALATGDIYPLHLHGDSYFYLLDQWIENSFILGSDLPRDEAIVRKSMTEAVTDHPAFLPLADNIRFQNIIRRLKSNEEITI